MTELAGDIGFAIDHIETQERFDYLAYHDALTGLANRSLFPDMPLKPIDGPQQRKLLGTATSIY